MTCRVGRRRWWPQRSLAVLVALGVLAGCSGDGDASDSTTTTEAPVVAVRDVGLDELSSRVCSALGDGSASSDATVDHVDLDDDGRDEALVSSACGTGALRANGVFADGSGSVALVGTFRGDDLTVVTGAGRTVAVVVPIELSGSSGTGVPLVERVVYKLDDGELDEVERRQMSEDEYFATFRPGEAPPERTDLIARWATGVALVEPVTCSGGGRLGSGFLVAPDLLVTNSHVVEDAVALRAELDDDVFAASLLGSDPVRDLALLRLSAPSDGHVFELATAEPQIGTEVTTLGYPLIRQLTVTTGEVSGVGRRLDVQGRFYEDAIQISAPVNPGNSGGPLLDGDGSVLGVNSLGSEFAENFGIAIPIATVQEVLAAWRDQAPVTPQPDPWCDTGNELVRSSLVTIHLPPVLDSLTKYVSGINQADRRRAWDIMSSSQQGGDFDRFQESVSTSTIEGFEITAIDPQPDDTLHTSVVFTSYQAPEYGRDGQTCTSWDLRYVMSQHADGVWRIDSSTPVVEPAACG